MYHTSTVQSVMTVYILHMFHSVLACYNCSTTILWNVLLMLTVGSNKILTLYLWWSCSTLKYALHFAISYCNCEVLSTHFSFSKLPFNALILNCTCPEEFGKWYSDQTVGAQYVLKNDWKLVAKLEAKVCFDWETSCSVAILSTTRLNGKLWMQFLGKFL